MRKEWKTSCSHRTVVKMFGIPVSPNKPNRLASFPEHNSDQNPKSVKTFMMPKKPCIIWKNQLEKQILSLPRCCQSDFLTLWFPGVADSQSFPQFPISGGRGSPAHFHALLHRVSLQISISRAPPGCPRHSPTVSCRYYSDSRSLLHAVRGSLQQSLFCSCHHALNASSWSHTFSCPISAHNKWNIHVHNGSHMHIHTQLLFGGSTEVKPQQGHLSASKPHAWAAMLVISKIYHTRGHCWLVLMLICHKDHAWWQPC